MCRILLFFVAGLLMFISFCQSVDADLSSVAVKRYYEDISEPIIIGVRLFEQQSILY